MVIKKRLFLHLSPNWCHDPTSWFCMAEHESTWHQAAARVHYCQCWCL